MAATAMPVVPVADELPENQQNYRETIAADQALYTQRQRQLHDAAAMRHVANDVFTPHARLRKVTQAIDDFCRDDSMNESKPPLVLVGEVGSGKSCILANWVRERRLRGRGVSSGNVQEFVFLHVAGCSRDSTTVSNLLFRIVTEIKHHFGLQMEISEREQKLSWEFIRALDTASRKGRVIIVIDGLNRLHSRGFAGLKWLPLHFPTNVRVIISSTASNADLASCEEDNKGNSSFFLTQPLSTGPRKPKRKTKDKNLAEVLRRKWPIVQVELLETTDRAAILRRFMESQGAEKVPEGGAGDAGTFMTELTGAAAEADGPGGGDEATQGRDGGLKLLKSQQLRLIDSPCARSPQFLRVTLEALRLAASECMDVCAVMEDCLGARSLSELYEVVLRRWTRGCPAPPVDEEEEARRARRQRVMQDAERAAAEAGRHARARAEAEADAEAKLKELDAQEADNDEFGAGGDDGDEAKTGAVGPEASAIDMLIGGGSMEEGDNDVGDSKTDARIAVVPLYGGVAISADVASTPALAAAMAGAGSGDNDAGSSALRMGDEAVESALTNKASGPLRDFAEREQLAKPLNSNASRHSLMSLPGDGYQSVLGSGPRAAEREAKAEATRAEARASGVMPRYLCGGQEVPGLGPVLGAALCFLYSSRHGLLEDEMKMLLLEEVRIEGDTRVSVDDPRLFTRLRRLLSTVLGASSVGQMFSLPPLCATLRGLVHKRYLNRGKGLWRVQQALIGYHSRAEVTPRRAEELPWLLERRQSWSQLKDVLLDLEMFEILWTPTHKFDLFRYWGILTGSNRDNGGGDFGGFGGGAGSDVESDDEGKGRRSTAATPGSRDGDASGAMVVKKRGTTAEAMRRVDIVDEYNKAVENWYYSAGRPTVADLQYVLLRIEDFFYHFAEQEGNTPHFVHRPLADQELRSLGINIRSKAPARGGAPSSPITLSEMQKGHYYYRRWLWMQFPWIALNNCEAVLRMEEEAKRNREEALALVPGGKQSSTAVTIRMTKSHMQRANRLARPVLSSSPHSLEKSFWAVKKHVPNQAARATSPHKYTSSVQTRLTRNATAPTLQQLDREAEYQQRVRKRPSNKTIVGVAGFGRDMEDDDKSTASKSRKKRALKARQASATPDPPRTRKASHRSTARSSSGRARGGEEEEEEAEKKRYSPEPLNLPPNAIPFSQMTNKTMRAGTKHPTVEAMMREDPHNAPPIFHGGIVDPKSAPAANTTHAFTSSHNANRPVHMQNYPITELEMELAQAQTKLQKLRRQHDRLSYTARERQRELDELHRTIAEREEQDAYNEACMEAGEAMMLELESRLSRATMAIAEAARLQTFYKRVIEVCQRCPAKDSHHLARVEKALQASKLELADKKAHTRSVDFEYRHLQEHERPALEAEVARSTKMRRDIIARLKKQRIRQEKARHALQKRAQQRQDIANQVAGDMNTAQEQRLKALTQQQQSYEKQLKTAAEYQRQRIQEYQDAFRRIRAATGIADASQLYSKFIGRDSAVDALNEQRTLYENRLAALRVEKEAAQRELEALQFGDNTITSRYIRQVDEQNFHSEALMNSNKEKYMNARNILKDVKAGITHLAHLLGFTDDDIKYRFQHMDERVGQGVPTPSQLDDSDVPRLQALVEEKALDLLRKLNTRTASKPGSKRSQRRGLGSPSRAQSPSRRLNSPLRSRPATATHASQARQDGDDDAGDNVDVDMDMGLATPPMGGELGGPAGGFGLEGLGLTVGTAGHVSANELRKPSSADNVFVPSHRRRRAREMALALLPDSDSEESETALQDLNRRGSIMETMAVPTPDDDVSATMKRRAGAVRSGIEVPSNMESFDLVQAANYIGMGMGVTMQPEHKDTTDDLPPGRRVKPRIGVLAPGTIEAVTNKDKVASRSQMKQLSIAVESKHLKKKRNARPDNQERRPKSSQLTE